MLSNVVYHQRHSNCILCSCAHPLKNCTEKMGNSTGRRRINRAQRHIREDKLGDWDHNTLYKFMKLSKIKNNIFSHSLCIMDVTLYLLSSLSKPTLCISCLHVFHPACGRSAADLGFGEAGERWVLFLIFSCDALLPTTRRLFALCCL